jgi:hypothetical protein
LVGAASNCTRCSQQARRATGFLGCGQLVGQRRAVSTAQQPGLEAGAGLAKASSSGNRQDSARHATSPNRKKPTSKEETVKAGPERSNYSYP